MAEFWVEVKYVDRKNLLNVLSEVFSKVFCNDINCITEINFDKDDNTIILYADKGIEGFLGRISEDLSITNVNKDLICNVKIGIIGE